MGTLEGEALLVAFHLEHSTVVGHHGEDETARTEDTEDVIDQGVVTLEGSVGLEGSVRTFGLGRHCRLMFTRECMRVLVREKVIHYKDKIMGKAPATVSRN